MLDDTLTENLAVADNETVIRVQFDGQATTAESSSAKLYRLYASDGSIHIVLQRLSDQGIVIDYRLRAGESVCYALKKRGEAVPTPLHWQSFSAPAKAPIAPPTKLIRVFSFSMRTGLLWNLLAVLPTLYYFFLPKGSVADCDNFFCSWVLPVSACILFIGIPCYIRAIIERRARRLPYGLEIMALLFCLTPLFFANGLLYLAGMTRDLEAPYYADSGGYVKWVDYY